MPRKDLPYLVTSSQGIHTHTSLPSSEHLSSHPVLVLTPILNLSLIKIFNSASLKGGYSEGKKRRENRTLCFKEVVAFQGRSPEDILWSLPCMYTFTQIRTHITHTFSHKHIQIITTDYIILHCKVSIPLPVNVFFSVTSILKFSLHSYLLFVH